MVRYHSKSGRSHALGCLVLAAMLVPSSAGAVPSFLDNVDFFDASFGAGGGSVTKSLTGGPDDGWVAFAATAGDLVTVTLSATNAGFSGAVVFDPADRMINLFDRANTVPAFGAGMLELVVQSAPFTILANPPSYDVLAGQTGTVQLSILTTGQYAVAVTCYQEMCSLSTAQPGSFTVFVSGNTVAVVGEPATPGLLGLGLAGLALIARPRARRRAAG